MLLGYQVEGATYRLSNVEQTAFANGFTATDRLIAEPLDNVELRRSEIRLGATFNKGLNDFIWVGVQAGLRLNYSYNLDDGEFYRGFDDEGYLAENTLSNTFYAQLTLSMVSP